MAWAEDDDTTITLTPDQPHALEQVQIIEAEMLLDYVKQHAIKSEIGSLFAAFFDRRREHLPENPYPEITKRFRQIEVRIRHKKREEIMDKVIDNIEAFNPITTNKPKLVPDIKVFGSSVLSLGKPKIESTIGLDLNESDDENDNVSNKSAIASTAEESIKVFGLEHVVNAIQDITYLQSIIKTLKPILATTERVIDGCRINKISLLSSPIFFFKSCEFLNKLSKEHVIFSHLFSRSMRKSNEKGWPHFMANGLIHVHNHVGITSVTFEKAVIAFAKFIQQQIYWLQEKSKISHQYRFFFKHLIVNDQNPNYWTFESIIKNTKKFHTNMKRSVAQRHTVTMIFYFIGPDESLIFECKISWHFFFRDQKKMEQQSSPRQQRRSNIYNLTSAQNKATWTPFSENSQHSCYSGFFLNYNDILTFIDFYKGLNLFLINQTQFNKSFTAYNLEEWKQILNFYDNLQYGATISYLYQFAVLFNTTVPEEVKQRQPDKFKERQDFKLSALKEMEMSLYGQGQLIQGFNNSVDRIIEILKIFDREHQQNEQKLKESNRSPRHRQRQYRKDRGKPEIDHRMAGQYIHKVLQSLTHKFEDLSDFYYPLYSEYIHNIPRIKYLLNECVSIIPSWCDLSKISTNNRSIIDQHLDELVNIFDIIGDTLTRDELNMAQAIKQWTRDIRKKLNRPKEDIKRQKGTNPLMHIQNAIDYNMERRKLPTSIPFQGTVLQYVVDTEMDKFFSETLFNMLTDALVFNPWVKVVLSAQNMSFQFDSYRITDQDILKKIDNTKDIKAIDAHDVDLMALGIDEHDNIDDIQSLYVYHGIFGYKSALLHIHSESMKTLHRDISRQIPSKIMIKHESNRNNMPSNHVFLGFVGDVMHYPYFDIALDEIEIIQNVHLSSSSFDQVVEIFANHCYYLAQYLYQMVMNITFISLTIGNNKYQCDMVIKDSNYRSLIKSLIQAAKSRQAIKMELMIVSKKMKKYLSITLNIFLIYHQFGSRKYKLCWPFRADIIFSSIFFDINDALKFWRAYYVQNIESEYNLEHVDYVKELKHALAKFESQSQLEEYFHTVLRYKALKNDSSGLVEIYRFFEESTFCGKAIESLQQLRLTKKALDVQKISRFVKNQMNAQVVNDQIDFAVKYSKKIVYSELLVFLDRLVLVYLKKHYELENATPHYVYNALDQMIKKIIPIKHATTMSWAKWLLMKNPDILVHL